MKRMVSFLMAATIFLTMSVSAAELDFLKEDYKSYESEMHLSFTVNEPMDFLDLLFDESQLSAFVNIKRLAESLFSSTNKADVKVSISDDYKKIIMSMESVQNIPAELNQNMKVTVDAKTGMWIDLDLTDSENPKYSMIAKYPFLDKYITMDIFDMMSESPEETVDQTIEIYDKLLRKETIRMISDKAVSLLSEYSTVSYRGNAVTLKMSDESAKKYILDILEFAMDFITGTNTENTDFLPTSVAESMLTDIKNTLDEVQIFGENGISITYKLLGKYIGSVDSDIHFDINLKNVAEALGADEVTTAKMALAGGINFTMHIKETYKNVNKNIRIDFPKLTEDNSVTIEELVGIGFGNGEYLGETQTSPYLGVFEEEYIPAGKDGAYFGVRNLFESAYGDNFDIVYDNGALMVKAAKGSYGFKEVRFRVGENIVNVDGMDLALTYPAIERNDKVYVDDFFVKAVFDYDLDSMTYDLINKTIDIGFWNYK